MEHEELHAQLVRTIKAIHDAAWLYGDEPAAPNNLTIVELDGYTVLEWDASDEAGMYTIEQAETKDGPWLWFGSTYQCEFVSPTPLHGWFRVTATSEAFRGPPSPAGRGRTR